MVQVNPFRKYAFCSIKKIKKTNTQVSWHSLLDLDTGKQLRQIHSRIGTLRQKLLHQSAKLLVTRRQSQIIIARDFI